MESSNKKLGPAKIAVIVWLIFIMGLFAGVILGCTAMKVKHPSTPPATVVQQIEALPGGTTIEYEFEQTETPQAETHTGGTTNVAADKSFWRGLSWFGLGGPEAAAKDQGLTIEGKNISAGQMRGYGWAEQLWTRIKSLFWFLTFGAVALVVLLFIPVTAPIASAIFRFLAALIPIVGSIFESIRAGIVYKKPLAEVVEGGEVFRVWLDEDVSLNLTTIQKDGVWELFKVAQMSSQDTSTQATVDKITKLK